MCNCRRLALSFIRSLAFLTLTVISASPQGTSLEQQEGCGKIEAAPFARTDQPVIWGAPYIVPTTTLKVVDETGRAVAGRQVIIHYEWLWLEYPYPEYPFGAWSDASELIRCITDADGSILLPKHKIEPRGWYNGKFAAERKPTFKGISIQVFVGDHIIASEYPRKELDKLQQQDKPLIVLPVN